MSIENTIRRIIREELQGFFEYQFQNQEQNDRPKFLTVKETAEILRIGRTATYELCHQSEHNGFPCIRDGNKIRIPYNALMNWIDQQTNKAI